jgi:CBS domain-containing protein
MTTELALAPETVPARDGDVAVALAHPPTISQKEPVMLVRDVMTSPAVTIRPVDEVAEAARILDRLSLTSLPVVEHNGRLVGIIGEADVIGRLTTAQERRSGTHRRVDVPRVRDAMTHRVLTVTADDDLAQVVGLMTGTTLKSLPVLLHDRVVGVVSRRDVVRALARGDLGVSSTSTAPSSAAAGSD